MEPRELARAGPTGPAAGGRLRWAAAVASAGVPAVVVLATFSAWRHELPERIASHWSGSPNGTPDGFSSTSVSATVIAGICLLALVIAVAVALLSPPGRTKQRVAPVVIAAVTATAGLLAGSWLTVATANLAADAPARAHLGLRLLWTLCLLWGVVPLMLLSRAPAPQQPAP